MPIPVQLKDVVEAIEPLADDYYSYINRETGEIVSFSEEEASMARSESEDFPDWFAEHAPKVREALSSESHIELPGKFDFHEYEVMERFAHSLTSTQLSDELLDALQGRGAFGRFKDFIEEKDIKAEWYAFRNQALEEMAEDFLENENIAYVKDSP